MMMDRDIVVSGLCKICMRCGQLFRMIHIDNGDINESFLVEEPRATKKNVKFKIHECEGEEDEEGL